MKLGPPTPRRPPHRSFPFDRTDVVRVGRLVRSLARYAARRPHEPDFAAFRHFADRKLFLDVGANVGQSALSFRLFNRQAPILSIEPNSENALELRAVRRVVRRFDFLIAAAGEETGPATLFVPTFRGVPLPGRASLVGPLEEDDYLVRARRRTFADFGFETRRVDVIRLDDLELEPGYVKLDVEDFELQALHGLSRTLERSRPVILVERTEALPEIRSFLSGLGYACFAYDHTRDRLVPYDGADVQNVFFLWDPGALDRNGGL